MAPRDNIAMPFSRQLLGVDRKQATGFEVVDLIRPRWRTALLQPHGVVERIEQRGSRPPHGSEARSGGVMG